MVPRRETNSAASRRATANGRPGLSIYAEGDQAAMIERSLSILERFAGTPPVGWLGPGLAQTLWTPELLAAAGIRYIGDWVYDHEPATIHTPNGELMALPHTLQLNPLPTI